MCMQSHVITLRAHEFPQVTGVTKRRGYLKLSNELSGRRKCEVTRLHTHCTAMRVSAADLPCFAVAEVANATTMSEFREIHSTDPLTLPSSFSTRGHEPRNNHEKEKEERPFEKLPGEIRGEITRGFTSADALTCALNRIDERNLVASNYGESRQIVSD